MLLSHDLQSGLVPANLHVRTAHARPPKPAALSHAPMAGGAPEATSDVSLASKQRRLRRIGDFRESANPAFALELNVASTLVLTAPSHESTEERSLDAP
jgi:hypothetical protein